MDEDKFTLIDKQRISEFKQIHKDLSYVMGIENMIKSDKVEELKELRRFYTKICEKVRFDDGSVPVLHFCVTHGAMKCLTLLLPYVSDLNEHDSFGRTPIFIAGELYIFRKIGKDCFTKLSKNQKADINILDANGNSLLSLAIEMHQFDFATELVNLKAMITNVIDNAKFVEKEARDLMEALIKKDQFSVFKFPDRNNESFSVHRS